MNNRWLFYFMLWLTLIIGLIVVTFGPFSSDTQGKVFLCSVFSYIITATIFGKYGYYNDTKD